jgi:hypothetical protein
VRHVTEKTLAIMILSFIFLAVAMGGCTGPAKRVVVTVGPTSAPVLATPSPTPGVTLPSVTVSGGVTSVMGSKNQQIKAIRLGEGAYNVNWSGSGTFFSFSLTDMEGNGGDDISKGRTSGESLLIVDGSTVLPGDFTLMTASDSGWAINISKPDTSSPAALPRAISCSEREGGVTKPFLAHAGYIWISYTLSRTPSGDGRVDIYDVYTGQSFYTRPITGGYTNGQSMAEVPADGIYIARITVPKGASYADITISQ